MDGDFESSATQIKRAAQPLDEKQSRLLFIFNALLSVAHLAQGIAVLVASRAAPPLVAVMFWAIAGPPSSGRFQNPVVLFNMRMDIAVAIFFFFAAVDHGITLLPRLGPIPSVWSWYKESVARGINNLRWWEYSISSSIMLVLICLTVGIRDINALIMGFGSNSAMIYFGLLHEKINAGREKTDWMPFIFGCIAGIVPWIALSTTLGLTQVNCLTNRANGTYTVSLPATTAPAVNTTLTAAAQCIPSFVFGVYASLLLLFFTFALNMVLQYLRVGPWRRTYFSECVYLWLSLIAKSVLAWQIFAGSRV
jgi:hypothetical protein